MNDGKGSPIIVVPILVLLLCAGIAALAGIALQTSDADETPVAAPITEADLGAPCATPPGPRPSDPAALPAWLANARACIDAELATLPGYVGSGVEGFQRNVLVVRWNGDVPEVVAKRVTVLTGEDGATVVGTRTATTS